MPRFRELRQRRRRGPEEIVHARAVLLAPFAGFLINGFAPLVDGLSWLKYLSPFYYYAGYDPIGRGVDVGDLAVLGIAAVLLTGVAVVGFQRRDLRG